MSYFTFSNNNYSKINKQIDSSKIIISFTLQASDNCSDSNAMRKVNVFRVHVIRVKQVLKKSEVEGTNVIYDYFMEWKGIPEVSGRVSKAFLGHEGEEGMSQQNLIRC